VVEAAGVAPPQPIFITADRRGELSRGRSTFHCRIGSAYRTFQSELNPQKSRDQPMTRFYQPDLSTDLDSPFVRDSEDKLIRRSYWLDMDDRTLVMVMVNGIGANLTNDEKRAHLIDLRREHLIDKVCTQEILPPER
jgi:hypothetical protein